MFFLLMNLLNTVDFSVIMVAMDERGNRDLKKILEENTKIARENHRLLKKIYRSIKWAGFFRMVYWTVLLGSAVGAYYFIQPFIDTAQNSFNSIKSGFGAIQDIGSLVE